MLRTYYIECVHNHGIGRHLHYAIMASINISCTRFMRHLILGIHRVFWLDIAMRNTWVRRVSHRATNRMVVCQSTCGLFEQFSEISFTCSEMCTCMCVLVPLWCRNLTASSNSFIRFRTSRVVYGGVFEPPVCATMNFWLMCSRRSPPSRRN